MDGYGGRWTGLRAQLFHTPVETGVPHETLVQVVQAMTTVPPGFTAPSQDRQIAGNPRARK